MSKPGAVAVKPAGREALRRGVGGGKEDEPSTMTARANEPRGLPRCAAFNSPAKARSFLRGERSERKRGWPPTRQPSAFTDRLQPSRRWLPKHACLPSDLERWLLCQDRFWARFKRRQFF